MAADYIEYTIIGKHLSQSELAAWLQDTQEQENEVNGHQHGYSGDTQTVEYIELHDEILADAIAASELCSERAEKWIYLVAVHLTNGDTYIGGWAAC